MMKNLAVKLGFAVIGLCLMLGYWTFFDKKPVSTGASHIPDKVLGGGGDSLIIDLDINGKAQVGMLLEQPRKPDGDQPTEEYYQNLDPGHYSFTVELAPKTMGTVDLRALQPQIGNKLSWTVTRNGKQIAQDSDTLDKPLQPGYAQGLQVQLESEEQATNQDSE
jgi:hypothetical protein